MKMKNLSSCGALVLDVTDIQIKLLGNTVNIISAVFVLDLTLLFILITFISRLLFALMMFGCYGYKTAVYFDNIYFKTVVCRDDCPDDMDIRLRFILIIFISRLLFAVMICLDVMDIRLRLC